MTEKRFEMIITGMDGSFYYLDKLTGDEINSTLELENKLNDLNEENEKLKERNNNQYTQLNRLWGLMEDKDWETMEQMVEEINTAEERLQREWGTYGDVE